MCIVAGGNQVVVVSTLLVEGAKLNQSVAHHIGIGSQPCLHLLHGIGGHLVPVFLMTIHHFQLAAILTGHGGSHFQIFLARAVPLLFLLGTYLDIEAVRLQSKSCKLVHYHTAIHATRQEHSDAFIL